MTAIDEDLLETIHLSHHHPFACPYTRVDECSKYQAARAYLRARDPDAPTR